MGLISGVGESLSQRAGFPDCTDLSGSYNRKDMNYRSIATLNRQIVNWLDQLPSDLDLIVGIPRSGLLVANLLALHQNLPLTDIDGFLAGKIFYNGPRGNVAPRKWVGHFLISMFWLSMIVFLQANSSFQ
jgi:hypothetical protein